LYIKQQEPNGERQVQDDAKYERTKAFFASRNASASTTPASKAPYATSTSSSLGDAPYSSISYNRVLQSINDTNQSHLLQVWSSRAAVI
jgi:hypothetical protein